ncbi:MAG: ABC transporter substrate-binding protein [Lacrimispora sp.]|uniref:ABC transporter substrate-binding protein n=1 Tax=Lacrimispora sp. TaxID=2719234 RepID=UPI0039E4C8AA
MKKRLLASTLAAVLLAASLAGCGQKTETAATTAGTEAATKAESADTTAAASGDKVTLNFTWWGNQLRNDVTKQAVDLYMSQNPGVEIKVEFTDWTGYWDKLSAMAAGGNLPDILQMDYSYLNQYQQSGQLANLSEFIDSGVIDTKNVPDSVIDSGSIDGKCYAISIGSNALVMTYDKAIVEEAGVDLSKQMTFDELYEVSKTIYEKTGVKTAFDGGINMMVMVARGNGSYLFGEIREGKTDAMKMHFETVEKFAKAEFAVSPDLLAEKDMDIVETKPIIDGTTWNDFSLSNQYIAVSNTAGRELGLTYYPTVNNAKTQPLYLKPGQFLSVAESSQNKEAAAKFIDWFTNSIECNEILMAERGIPVNTEVAAAIKPKAEAISQSIFDYISQVGEIATPIDVPDPSGKGEIEALGKTMVEALRYGDATAEEAADQFVAESKKILEEAAK